MCSGRTSCLGALRSPVAKSQPCAGRARGQERSPSIALASVGLEVNICLTCCEVSSSTPGVRLLKKCAVFFIFIYFFFTVVDKIEMGGYRGRQNKTWRDSAVFEALHLFPSSSTLRHFVRGLEHCGWRDGSLDKGSSCSSRGLDFGSQNLQLRTVPNCLQLTPAPGICRFLLPSTGTCTHIANIRTDKHACI